MADAVIRAEQLSRRFGAVTALEGANLCARPGEAIAVLGPNGAGKTTLLRLCATLLRPTSGRLSLFGEDIGKGAGRTRRRIGMLSHRSFLYPDLTPVENLLFYGRMFSVTDVQARVPALLERVGLLPWAGRPVRALSRGLEQRCALARAVLHEPDLLLLDEPFTGLDVDAIRVIEQMLGEQRRRGVTVLLATHDLGRAAAFCERGWILGGGKPRWDGTVAGMELPRFEQIYAAAVHGGRAAVM